MAAVQAYRGRFAPSPTGPLHRGSLVAALGSYLDARAHGGAWLLRIEDIDPPREVPGSTDAILRSLEAHGLQWDDKPLMQSTRLAAFAEALATLEATGAVFPCVCTRASLGPGGSCGGRCQPQDGAAHSLRLRLPPGPGFDDEFLGFQAGPAAASDIVLRRKDGLFAYALAVAVDDAWQQISHVLRGRDLLDATHAQLAVLHALGSPAPRYGHLPLVVDARGYKLSKQTGAQGLDDGAALANLRAALRCLAQSSADEQAGSPAELLDIALELWDRSALTRATVYAAAPSP